MTTTPVPDRATAGDDRLGHRAAQGTFITLAGQGANLLVQMASVVILARLLTPSAYGLVAMVIAVVGVSQIFRDFGLSSAAIQAPTLSREQQNNLFWLNTVIGVFLAVTIFLAAPFVEAIYRTDHIETITRCLAITFVLSGASTQYRADLNRRLRFGALAIADIASSIIALILATTVALLGGGFWALVIQQVAQGAIMLGIVVAVCGWTPRGWIRDTPIRSFVKFGWNYVGAQLINYVANNLDSFLIGARFGAGPAGVYNRAFQLLMRPLTQLRAPSTTVALPTLSRLQDDDKRFGAYILKGQALLGYPITIVMGVVVGAATPLTVLALGSEWSDVSPILRFLAVAGAFQTLSFVGLWVYLSKGIANELRRFTLVSAGIRTACVGAGIYWGVNGVAAGYGAGPALAWPLAMWWLNRKVPIPTAALICGGLRILGAGVAVASVTGAACFVMSAFPPAVQILASVLLAAAVCTIFVLASQRYRQDAFELMHVAKEGLPNKVLPNSHATNA